MNALKQFAQHDAGPLAQFLKYAICGGIATVTHIVVFHLAAWLILPALREDDAFVRLFHLTVPVLSDGTRAARAMADNGIAFLVSNFVAYWLNIRWVFRAGRHRRIVEIGLFYAVSGVSIAIGTSIMGFLIRRYGMTTTTAFGANLVASLLINFAMRKFVIFHG